MDSEIYLAALRASQILEQARTDLIQVPFDNAPPQHKTYIQIVGTGGFFATCMSCGPDPFPNRSHLADAEADARRHGELVNVYPQAILEAHDKR